MAENISTTPYIIQINEPFKTIHLSEELNNLGLQIDPGSHELKSFNSLTGNPIEILQENEPLSQNYEVQEQPCFVQIVYPQDLCLSSVQNIAKRGRPKKKKQDEQMSKIITPKLEIPVEPSKTVKTRTRSGRLVKLPKHIEKDFKKIETATEEQEVQLSDFQRFEEKENSKIEFAELQKRKRSIPAQYRCPKCCKAYLGKNKMIQHLKKYPDHGPLPEGYQEFNFDVWNYLFDITQKCKSGQRGIKFCEELSNLLHNVQLLKSALFKTVTDNKNSVQIDKVLGNAIGLAPGKYKFDENELYKDVTVLKLITNSDFFKPNINKQVSESSIIKNESGEDVQKERCDNKKLKQNSEQTDFLLVSETQQNTLCTESSTNDSIKDGKVEENVYFNSKPDHCDSSNSSKISENVISESFSKKMDVDNQILSSDLLTENLLLQSLPNPRNSVEDLMLTSVDNGSNLLDNSTSSDEVMNVDQFVNERFKKIIGPDVELGNTSLNLDLPSLELFQFHTS